MNQNDWKYPPEFPDDGQDVLTFWSNGTIQRMLWKSLGQDFQDSETFVVAWMPWVYPKKPDPFEQWWTTTGKEKFLKTPGSPHIAAAKLGWDAGRDYAIDLKYGAPRYRWNDYKDWAGGFSVSPRPEKSFAAARSHEQMRIL